MSKTNLTNIKVDGHSIAITQMKKLLEVIDVKRPNYCRFTLRLI